VTRVPDLLGSVLVTIGVGALALALVKGPTWGWSSAKDVVAFVASVLAIVAFWRRSARHPLPVVELSLLRMRIFTWASVTTVLYSIAFGGTLLAIVLWLQNVWGYSALKTGLAIVPGPLMVPIFTAVALRMSSRIRVGRLAALGCAIFTVGVIIIGTRIGETPSYTTSLLPGWILAGIGVAFAMPTMMSAATASLPPSRSSTGSAVVVMARQIGLVLGVSLLVAVVGTPSSYPAVHAAFQHAWWVIAGVAGLAALTALRMTPRTRSA
jgi:MFS family permease